VSNFVVREEFLGLPWHSLKFKLPEELPAGYVLTVYVPVMKGDIIDNSLWEEEDPDRGISHISSTWTILGPYRSNVYVEADQTWDAQGNSISTIGGTSYQEERYFFPAFKNPSIDPESINAGETKEVSLPFGFSYHSESSSDIAVTFHFLLPPWLELDADDINYFQAISYGQAGSMSAMPPGVMSKTSNNTANFQKTGTANGYIHYSFALSCFPYFPKLKR
jgi:hypothetical protein